LVVFRTHVSGGCPGVGLKGGMSTMVPWLVLVA